ncbi:hypothetical protein COO60DRAFT_40724 [Scenedesmus sp. NREL 46B-D3]|nr:hypothetical protein COO60DRAFT_40724 [Scenedesmus sp. NREL 46B-D3]
MPAGVRAMCMRQVWWRCCCRSCFSGSSWPASGCGQHMQPACSSGNMAVLLQLLQAAADAAAAEHQAQWQQWHGRQHVLAVLLAGAAAGNAAVWQQLLEVLSRGSSSSNSSSSSSSSRSCRRGSTATAGSSTGTGTGTGSSSSSSSSAIAGSAPGSSSSSNYQQAEHQDPELIAGSSGSSGTSSAGSSNSRSGVPCDPRPTCQQPAMLLPGLQLSCLAAKDWLLLLQRVLPKFIETEVRTNAVAVGEQQDDEVRCCMADQLWRCLQEMFPASAVAARQLLQGSCSWQLLGAGVEAGEWRVWDEGTTPCLDQQQEGFTEPEWTAGCSLAQEHAKLCELEQQHKQQQRQQQQQQQQQQQHQQQQKPRCGPAPLWQLSLLALLETSPNTVRHSCLLMNPLLNMDALVQFYMAYEALPDAMLQQLTLAYACRKIMSVDGQHSRPATLFSP